MAMIRERPSEGCALVSSDSMRSQIASAALAVYDQRSRALSGSAQREIASVLRGGRERGVAELTKPPNTRVQRTRSSASPPYSPLTRSP